MEKKKWVKLAGFAMVFLLSLFLCVGCADNSAEDSDEVTFIDFSRESASSRGIESWNENLYPPESLYWTYKATKIRGNYTTGQTLTEKAVVKNGPAQGLGTVGPFSVGVWKFELFGYLSCAEKTTGELEFTDLVYTGKTGTVDNAYTTTIDKRTGTGTPMQQIIFELAPDSEFWQDEMGELAVEGLKLIVPEGQKIFGTKPASGKTGAEIVIKIWDGEPSADNKPIAKSISKFTTDVKAGTTLESGTDDNKLLTPTFIDYSGTIKNKFSEGIHNLYIAVEYQDKYTAEKGTASGQTYYYTGTANASIYDNGYAPIGAIVSHPLAFKKGVKTTISGDVNDIKVAEENRTATRDTHYVASKGSGTGIKYYTSIDEAAKDTSVSGDITLLISLNNAGSVTKSCTIVTENFILGNLTISGSTTVITLKSKTGGTYAFSGDGKKIVEFNNENKSTAPDTVRFTTDGVTLTVNAENDNVYHTGSAGTVTVTAVKGDKANDKGYHLRESSAVTTLNVAKGFVDFGENTKVTTLKVTGSSDVTMLGRLTTEITNFANGEPASYSDEYTGLVKVTLKPNGATSSTADKVLYGVDGTYITLKPSTDYYTCTVGGIKSAFVCWNEKATPDATSLDFADKSKIVVKPKTVGGTDGPILYAQWSTVIGSGYKIAEVMDFNGAEYTFYDATGAQVAYEGSPTVEKLNVVGKVATSYYVRNKAAGTPAMFRAVKSGAADITF